MSSEDRKRRAESLLTNYRRELEAGDDRGFDSLVADHPDVADELRAAHAQWLRSLLRAAETPHRRAKRGGSLATGQVLLHYEILGPLGAGGMGEVYRARDTRLDRDVAIKVLPDEFASVRERLRRFEREAKALASLNHPNVAQVYGVDAAGDRHFIVMEYVPGEDLEERLRRGPLPLERSIDACRQVAAGLEAAHEAGVIHRDLKPANVRLTPSGVVKVLDFGLAKRSRGPDSSPTTDSVLTTEDGRVLGTPTYMAPEQARGSATDERVDTWALGCLFFECLTGRRAFAGETVSETLAAILEREPDLSALPPEVPTALRNLISRCLEKDPDERPRSVGEAMLVLEGLRGQSFFGRRGLERRALALAMAVVLLFVAAIVVVWRVRQNDDAALSVLEASEQGEGRRAARADPEGASDGKKDESDLARILIDPADMPVSIARTPGVGGRVGRVLLSCPIDALDAASWGFRRSGTDEEVEWDADYDDPGVVISLWPGDYDLDLNGSTLGGLQVRAGHDTTVIMGVLRVEAPGEGYTSWEVRLPTGENVIGGSGREDVALFPGTYSVAMLGREDEIVIRAGRVTTW